MLILKPDGIANDFGCKGNQDRRGIAEPEGRQGE